MSFPIEVHIGAVHISLHIIFETLAFAIGFRYFQHLRRDNSDHMSDQIRIKILTGAIFGAFIFSRLLGALENPTDWMNSQHFWLYLFANKTIVGGLLGGLWGVEIAKLIIGEKRSSGDLFTYPLILAMMIGRLGCFTSGITEPTFGIQTDSPLGMDLGDGVMRHPVALYEIFFLAGLWLSLRLQEYNRPLESGLRFKIFMILYLVFRFMIDFIKPTNVIAIGLSSIQFACLIGLLYYLGIIVKYKWHKALPDIDEPL